MNKNFEEIKENIKYCKLLALIKIMVFFTLGIYISVSILLSIYLKNTQVDYLAGFGYSTPLLFILIPLFILFVIMYINNFKTWKKEINLTKLNSNYNIKEITPYILMMWMPIFVLFFVKKLINNQTEETR